MGCVCEIMSQYKNDFQFMGKWYEQMSEEKMAICYRGEARVRREMDLFNWRKLKLFDI